MFPLALTKRDGFPLVHPTVKRRLVDPDQLRDLTGRHAMLSPLHEDSFVESVAMRAINVTAAYSGKDSSRFARQEMPEKGRISSTS
jgi:hypothetical protein